MLKNILQTKIARKIHRQIGKTIFDYKMINPDDRILVAVSGGKDSLTMLIDFIKRISSFPIPFEFEAVHVIYDFKKNSFPEEFEKFTKDNHIKSHLIKINILKRIKNSKKMNCYWCSTQRRIELMRLALENDFNKIALGHHLDDIVETFLMNIFFKAEVATMMPVMQYNKYPVTIIRPLASCKEDDIKEYIKYYDFNIENYCCAYNSNSKRNVMKNMLNQLKLNNRHIYKNIMHAMQNINQEYLLSDQVKLNPEL